MSICYFILVNNSGEYFHIGDEDYYTGWYKSICDATIFDTISFKWFKRLSVLNCAYHRVFINFGGNF